MSVLFHSTLYVDTNGVVMTSRVFFIHAAIEEMQANGFLSDDTLSGLNADELVLVLERTQRSN